jgi:hypothetical protein
LSPVFGWNVIAVWKDTAFSLAVLWTLALLLRIAQRGTITPADGAWLGGALSLVWLFRHNGPGLVIPLVMLIAWRYRVVALAGIVATIVTGTAIVLAISFLAYRAANVTPAGHWLKEQHLIHQVAGLLSAGTPVTGDEHDALDRILPISDWRAAYRCHSAIDLLFHSGMDLEAFDRSDSSFRIVWARLALRNPRALLAHWLCVTRFVWSTRSKLYIGPLSDDGGTVDPNPEGLCTTPWTRPGNELLTGAIRSTLTPRTALRVLVWQPAFPLYVFLGSLVVAMRRARGVAPLLFWLPGLCNTLTWLAVAQSPQLRFQWPLVLMTPLLLALAGADWRRISPRRCRSPATRADHPRS